MKKEIDLDEIILSHNYNFHSLTEIEKDLVKKELLGYDYEDFKEILKKFAEQLLKLAAENADADINDFGEIVINKQSILDTINQIK